MCGIAGIYNPSGVDTRFLTEISKTIRHRGPDDEGFMIIDQNNSVQYLKGRDTITELANLPSVETFTGAARLAFVHRRLSIIDLSPAGHQPMVASEFGLSIVYNGEIYNYLELRLELQHLGYTFKTESDTEVILLSYKQWSENCVSHFIGMWAFAIFDHNKNILFCSRDRFGIKPFYYYEKPGLFAFASELKALFALPQIKPEMDEAKAIEFLVNSNMNFQGKTFFSGIYHLNQGHNMVYDLKTGKSSVQKYYQLQISNSLDNISPNDAVSQFSDLIESSIKLHLRSDVPVGSCLSGGLDSGTILARVMSAGLTNKFSTFTAAFPGSHVDETKYIRALKERYDFSDFYTYPDLNKILREADLFLWHQELPVQSTSMFAQWEVMKLAHEHSVKVLLDGQGMDEILGGYSEFTGSYLLGMLTKGRFHKFLKAYSDLKSNYKTSSILNELSRASFYYLPEIFRYRFYSARRIGSSIISRNYNDVLKEMKFPERITNSMKETSVNSINNILPALLRYEDRSSMAFSVESRVPYLDHRIAEFCLNLPDELKIHKGWTKYILRKSSEPYLPNDITWRKEKFGFVTPERLWTEQVKEHVYEIVMENNIPAIIDRRNLLNILQSRINDNIKYGEIWKILLFIRWHNLMFVQRKNK
jgi:asparagine synthase (glutamine-hydrolysing)